MVITREQFLEFLKARGVQSKCPCCGSEEWLTAENDDGDIAMLILSNEGGDIDVNASNIPTLLIACGNCGFIRQHARNLIVNYIEGLKSGNE